MGSVGTRLREARESRGLTIEQVEEQTRIRRAFITALEEERFDALPGAVYVRGFLRSYAGFLGLPPEEVLAEYQVESGVPSPTIGIPTVLDEPLIVGSPSVSILPRVFVALMALLVVLVGGWYGYARFYLHEDPLELLEERGILPGDLLASVRNREATATTPAGRATITRPATLPVGVPTVQPSPAATESTEQPTPTVTETATRPSVPTPTPRRTFTPTPTPTATVLPPDVPITGQVVVQARATVDCWLSVEMDG